VCGLVLRPRWQRAECNERLTSVSILERHSGDSQLIEPQETDALSPARLHRVVSPQFLLNRTGCGGRRQNPILADHLRRATGLSLFGLLDYRERPHCMLHSPRTERMTEKSTVTPSAMMVQIKKKAPLDLAMLPPTPFPITWMTGMDKPRSDPTSFHGLQSGFRFGAKLGSRFVGVA